MKNLSNLVYNGNNPQYSSGIKSSNQKLISVILFIYIIFIYFLYKNILKSLDLIRVLLDKVSSGKFTTTISNTDDIYPNITVINNFVDDYWSRCMKCSKT